jgi:hypothetical protein
VIEGVEYDLTGATLDFYDFDWMTTLGDLGEEKTACKIAQFRDRFTGLTVELPLSIQSADTIALGLAASEDRGRMRWLKRALPQAWRDAQAIAVRSPP